MCLDRITRVFEDDNSEIMLGYKVFKLDEIGRLIGEIYSNSVRDKDRWLDEQRFREKGFSGDNYIHCTGGIYETGWHGFVLMSDAERWIEVYGNIIEEHVTIKKVLFRYIVVLGVQYANREVIVAKEMFILDDKEIKNG